MSERRFFSGIQPSGDLHIGNYIGAVQHWAKAQDKGESIYCVVDLHAITVDQDPEKLRQNTLDAVALLLAAGVDPEKSILFVQSHNPDHASLGWIMNAVISMGEMNRMTQFKEKSDKKDFVSVGLFDYPALMAADILLYDTTHVPVGDDQKQHIELARDAATRFNSKFGETFTIPEASIPKVGARISSLADPTKKMSKSDKNSMATVAILDTPEAIKKKIMSAVTDSDNEVKYSKEKPGISNLIDIHSQFSGKTVKDIEKEFAGKGYGDFKSAVADAVIEVLSGFQKKYNKVREGDGLHEVLQTGAEKAHEISHQKLADVYAKVGFLP